MSGIERVAGIYLISSAYHALGDIQRIEPLVTQVSVQYRNNNLIYCRLVCCVHEAGIGYGEKESDSIYSA